MERIFMSSTEKYNLILKEEKFIFDIIQLENIIIISVKDSNGKNLDTKKISVNQNRKLCLNPAMVEYKALTE